MHPLTSTGKSIKRLVKCLDSYSFDDDKIGLIKTDTEGFEVAIIKGALKTIRKHTPRLILEMHDSPERVATEIMRKLPYYKWRKVRRDRYERGFHLVGDPIEKN